MANNTQADILHQLDQCTEDFTFPMLDNGYIYLGGAKMTAYSDKEHWVLIIEVVGFNYRGGGHNGISNCLHIFGNRLQFGPGTRNENFLGLTDDSDEGTTFDEEYQYHLNKQTNTYLLRNKVTTICHDREKYKAIGIVFEEDDEITVFEFLRLQMYENSNDFWATEEEIRERIPREIPKIMELYDWFHPDLVNGELPSTNETFIQIAKVLETGNTNHYKPIRKSNTHWSNWLDGGTL